MATQKERFKYDDFVKLVRPDPKSMEPVVLLRGFVGPSSETGHVRIYSDLELSEFVEIPKDMILHMISGTKADEEPVPSYVWVKSDTVYTYGDPTEKERPQGSFLEGDLYRQYETAKEAGLDYLQPDIDCVNNTMACIKPTICKKPTFCRIPTRTCLFPTPCKHPTPCRIPTGTCLYPTPCQLPTRTCLHPTPCYPPGTCKFPTPCQNQTPCLYPTPCQLPTRTCMYPTPCKYMTCANATPCAFGSCGFRSACLTPSPCILNTGGPDIEVCKPGTPIWPCGAGSVMDPDVIVETPYQQYGGQYYGQYFRGYGQFTPYM